MYPKRVAGIVWEMDPSPVMGWGRGGAGRLRTQRNIRYPTCEGFGRCGRGWTLEGAQVASGPSSLAREGKKEIRCVVVFSSGW